MNVMRSSRARWIVASLLLAVALAPSAAATPAPAPAAASLVAPAVPAPALQDAEAPAAADTESVGRRWGPHAPASSYGDRFDFLFNMITLLIGVSFLIVLVLLFIPVLRDRAGNGKKAHFDHGSSLKDKRVTAVVSVIVFLALDASVLWVAMEDLREGYWNVPRGEEEMTDAYRVQVLGQQWSWNFRATGADGEFGTADDIVTINHLTVPQNRAVVLNLASKDVIHSLYIPDMRLKRDANPGAVNEAWFEPIVAGDFEILCAELCGYAHYQMASKLTVIPEELFDEWEADASIMAEAAYDADDMEAQWAWDFRN